MEESDHSSAEDDGEDEALDALLVQALSMAKADAAISEGLLFEIGEIIKPDIRFDDVLLPHHQNIRIFFQDKHL